MSTDFSVHNLFYDRLSNEFIGVNKYGPAYLKFKGPHFTKLQYFTIDSRSYNLSGHVASTAKDSNYYLTAINSKSFNSCVLSINKTTNKCSQEFELEVTKVPAHDCKFTPDEQELVVTSSNNIHFYSPANKKLRSQKVTLTDAESSLRHFSINQNNVLCLQSNVIKTPNYTYEKAQVVVVSHGKIMESVIGEVSSLIKNNELLDFSFNSSGDRFACVHGGSYYVSIWQTSPLKLLKLMPFSEEPVRVFQFANDVKILVVERQGFSSIDVELLTTQRLNAFKGVLKRTFAYSHELVVAI